MLNTVNVFMRFIYSNLYFENINYLKEFYEWIKNKPRGTSASTHEELTAIGITFLLEITREKIYIQQVFRA